MGFFEGRDVLSALEFTRDAMEELFRVADHLKEEMRSKRVLDHASGRILATVFLEPSTRTRLSFHYAMVRIGGEVVDFGPEQAASIAKGETLEDTIRMVDGYGPDVIALRQRVPGGAKTAAEIAEAPLINAGDGWNEHPTQALLDLYTMREEFGRIDGLKIGIMGDLKYGRTPSSLSYALSKYSNVEITYIAPKPLQIRDEVLRNIEGRVRIRMVERVEDVMEELDVLYVTRLQKERFPDPGEYERLRGSYRITAQLLSQFKKLPIIMHPLPRVDELSADVDEHPKARYFQQARNGMYVRAALLKLILGV